MRDAQVGVLWEGTSNINALDVIGRAVGKTGAHTALRHRLTERLGAASLPDNLRRRLGEAFDRALLLAEDVARHPEAERMRVRRHRALQRDVTPCCWPEGARSRRRAPRPGGRLVLEHRLAPRDPLAPDDDAFEHAAIDLVLGEGDLAPAEAMRLL